MADERLDLYCEITKGVDEATVGGYVTSGAVDLGDQIVDPKFIKEKFPPWCVKWGNTRAQHDPRSPIGVVDPSSLKFDGDKPHVEIRVVDPVHVAKAKAGIYKGISIGIKNPKIVPDVNASKGRIVDGEIIEISLVDRPANPEALITVIKSLGNGEWKDEQIGAVLTKEGVAAGMAAAEKAPAPGSPLAERERLLQLMAQKGDGAIAEMAKGAEPNHSFGAAAAPEPPIGWQPRTIEEYNQMLAAARGEVQKKDYSTEQRKKAADEGAARPDGSYPIYSEQDVKNAVSDFGRASGSEEDKAHIKKRAKALGCEDCLPDTWKSAIAEAEVEKVQSGNSKRSHESHAHPFDGTHNHAHGHMHPYSGSHVVHHHAHAHEDDDIHGAMHEGRSHEPMAMKAADMTDGLKDKLVAHLYQFPAPEKPAALKAAEDAVAMAVKAAKDFDIQYPKAEVVSRPARLEDTTTNGLSWDSDGKPMRSKIESTAMQTEQDRDGDIDGMAQQEATGSPGIAPEDSRPSGASGTSLASKDSLELTFAAHREDLIKLVLADKDFQAYLDSLVKSTVFTVTSNLKPANAPIPMGEVAKMAGSLATGLQAVATLSGQLQEGQESLRADVAKSVDEIKAVRADLEKVKGIAQPMKGVGLGSAEVVAVQKGFILDPVTFQAPNDADPSSPLRAVMNGDSPAQFAARLATLNEQQRMALGAEMIRQSMGR